MTYFTKYGPIFSNFIQIVHFFIALRMLYSSLNNKVMKKKLVIPDPTHGVHRVVGCLKVKRKCFPVTWRVFFKTITFSNFQPSLITKLRKLFLKSFWRVAFSTYWRKLPILSFLLNQAFKIQSVLNSLKLPLQYLVVGSPQDVLIIMDTLVIFDQKIQFFSYPGPNPFPKFRGYSKGDIRISPNCG